MFSQIKRFSELCTMLSVTVLLVVIVSLELVNSRDSDRIPHLQPDFGPAPNITRVQVDSTAFLHCNILNLQEDSQVFIVYHSEY